jgi:hypothetical protein
VSRAHEVIYASAEGPSELDGVSVGIVPAEKKPIAE